MNGLLLWVLGGAGTLFLYAGVSGYTPASIIQSYAVPGTTKTKLGVAADTAPTNASAGSSAPVPSIVGAIPGRQANGLLRRPVNYIDANGATAQTAIDAPPVGAMLA